MLFIDYGCPEHIYYYVDNVFDDLYESSWMKNPLNIRILNEIDNCHLEFDGLHDNDNEDLVFSIKEISSGAKALMICNMEDEVNIWGSIFGDNCTPILQEIATEKNIYIYLQHRLRFEGYDVAIEHQEFPAFSMKKQRVYKDYREYVHEAIHEVTEFAHKYYYK